MKTKISLILTGIMLSAMILTTTAVAYPHGGYGHGGYGHGGYWHGGGHVYYNAYIGWPWWPTPVYVDPSPVVVVPGSTVVETAPVVVAQQGPAAGNGYSGSWWSGLPESSKLKFVSAYVQAHKGGEPVLFAGKSYKDFVKGLNAFYQDQQNQVMTIDMALDVVTLKLNGYAEYADCMNGYYIMSSSPKLFNTDMVNSKYDECSKLPQPGQTTSTSLAPIQPTTTATPQTAQPAAPSLKLTPAQPSTTPEN